MTDTPRTDALIDSITEDGAIPLHHAAKVAEFACALERESAKLRGLLREARSALVPETVSLRRDIDAVLNPPLTVGGENG